MAIAALYEWTEPVPGVDIPHAYEGISRLANDGEPMDQRSAWGKGMIAHIAALTETGGFFVVDVWEDQQGMDAWNQRLQRAMGQFAEEQSIGDIPQPQVRLLQAHHVVTE